jgi:hypothetical protein
MMRQQSILPRRIEAENASRSFDGVDPGMVVTMIKPFPDRLPLVVGATGHRDLREQDVPQLEREVAAIIARLRRDYLRNDSETPIIILSSLAEGADRLVARVGLAHGAYLVAPLPLPVEEYRRDFEPGLAPSNATEFDALLATAIAAPVMPFTPDNSLDAVRADSDKRAEQYRAVGLFIAQHCNVLLALWDGHNENMSAGGTAEVVAFKRQGIPLAVSASARASLDASEIGPVIHIVTPRQTTESSHLTVSVPAWGRRYVAQFQRDSRRRPPSEHWVPATPAEQEVDAWTAFATLVGLTRRFNREAATLDRGKRASMICSPIGTGINRRIVTPRARAPTKWRRDGARSTASLIPSLSSGKQRSGSTGPACSRSACWRCSASRSKRIFSSIGRIPIGSCSATAFCSVSGSYGSCGPACASIRNVSSIIVRSRNPCALRFSGSLSAWPDRKPKPASIPSPRPIRSSRPASLPG